MGNKLDSVDDLRLKEGVTISASRSYGNPGTTFDIPSTDTIFTIWKTKKKKRKIDCRKVKNCISIQVVDKLSQKEELKFTFPRERLFDLGEIDQLTMSFRPAVFKNGDYSIIFRNDNKVVDTADFKLVGELKQKLKLKIGRTVENREVKDQTDKFEVGKDIAVFATLDCQKTIAGYPVVCWCIGEKDLGKGFEAGTELLALTIPIGAFSHVSGKLKFSEKTPPGQWALKIYAEPENGKRELVISKFFEIANPLYKTVEEGKKEDVGTAIQKVFDKTKYELKDKSVDLYDSIDAIRKKFDAFDHNKDGVLQKNELADFLEEDLLGLDEETQKKTVDKVFKEIDLDGNGTIEFNEFVEYITKKKISSEDVIELEKKKIEEKKTEEKKTETEVVKEEATGEKKTEETEVVKEETKEDATTDEVENQE